ncbi:MAG: DUF222 domain-containing protein, partial [Candidatus Dormibacteraeota bacterium]|nr:DUF222 domain-containing protein [Candidatus Dormibacteraeota bacterium]
MCDGVHEDVDPAAAVLQAADRLRAQPPQQRDGAASGARLITLTRARDLLNLEIAREADAFGASGQWEAEGSNSPQDWLRHRCRMATADAYTAVTVGAQMATLRESTAAVDAGRIGFAHLDLMARTAAAVERCSGGRRSLDEHLLLQLAEAHSVGRFYYDCYHARHAEDPQGALQEHVDAVERRYLEFSMQRDQLVRVSGLLDTVGYAAVRTQLEPLAKRNGAEDRRLRSRRLADAWVESAVHVLDQGTLPQHGSQRPHLQVTATLETLLGAAGAPGGEMEYAGPLTAATVRRLACDSRLVRVLLDAESAVIDVGRARRTAPPATLRALRIRDGG